MSAAIAKRVGALEAASTSIEGGFSVICISFVKPGELNAEPVRAKIASNGEWVYRTADESVRAFTDRMTSEAIRRSPDRLPHVYFDPKRQ